MRRTIILTYFLCLTLSTKVFDFLYAGCEDSFVISSSQENANTQTPLEKYREQIEVLISQYSSILAPYQNPFAFYFSADGVDMIFRELSKYVPLSKGLALSPLSIINNALNESFIEKSTLDSEVIEWVIEESRIRLESKVGTKLDLQSNLLALEYSLEYLNRYSEVKLPEDILIIQKKPDNKQKKPNNPKDLTVIQSLPIKYPNTPDRYKPHTKKIGGGSKPGEYYRLCETNFKVRYFVHRYYHNINRGAEQPFQEGKLPLPNITVPTYQPTENNMVVRTLNETSIRLYIPNGYSPLQSKDPRVTIRSNPFGGYIMELNKPVAEVEIPLVEEKNINLSQQAIQILTRRVGFQVNEWPDLLKEEIFKKFKPGNHQENPLVIASFLEKHIQNKYLYSLDERPETDPPEALLCGEFQCDLGSYTVVGILRDHYQIPSRVVVGYRAKEYKGGIDGRSYLVLPSELHAWVQVYFRGRWYDFDPTPIKKSREEEEQKEKSDYSDISDLSIENNENDAQNSNPSNTGSSKGNNGKNPTNHFEVLKKNSEDRLAEVNAKSPPKDKEEEEEKNIGVKRRQDKEIDKYFQDEILDKSIDIGNISLKPSSDQNALQDRLLRTLLRIILNPMFNGNTIQNYLHQTRSYFFRFSSEKFKLLQQEALRTHEVDHPSLVEWVQKTTYAVREEELKNSYRELNRIKKALSVYSRTLDQNGKFNYPTELMRTIDLILAEFRTLSFKHSKEIALVQSFFEPLPSVIRKHLEQKYGIKHLGNNPETLNIASELKNGNLNDMRLVALLTPLTNFILNSKPAPERKNIRTWQRDIKKPIGNDYLPFQRFSDVYRSYLGQPGKSLIENIADGTAYVRTTRKIFSVPSLIGNEGAERITVVLFDTSGSMFGTPEAFQAALITAFASNAISDIAPNGKHRHRVVLLPFDNVVHDPIYIRSTAEALDLLKNYKTHLKNRQGGTDIQSALIHGLKVIEEAEKNNDEALAAANIILMSDGQSDIDIERIKNARARISRKTPVQTMFIAIQSTNPSLVDLVGETDKIGFERVLYREFTEAHMNEIISESKGPITLDESLYYSDATPDKLPNNTFKLMAELRRLSANYIKELASTDTFEPNEAHQKKLERLFRNVAPSQVNLNEKEDKLSEFELILVRARRMLQGPFFENLPVLDRCLDDLMTHFETITGRKFESLNGRELGHLQHLLNSWRENEKDKAK